MRERRREPFGPPLNAWLALAWIALAGPAAAAAERLPLRDGGWIEIRGEARVDRGRAIFRTAEGYLRSLPLAEIGAVETPEASRSPAGIETGRWREYPSGAVVAFDDPVLEPPPPLPRRPGSPDLPPDCVLANARPGDPPVLACGSRGPAPRSEPDDGAVAGDP